MPSSALPGLPVLLTFADGLVGLPQLRSFSVRPIDETPFLVLDCVEDEAFGFVVADADTILPGMTAELVAAGHLSDEQRALVLLALHGDPPSMTANLAGPLVVDPATGAAHQLVLEGEGYPLRAPVTGGA